MDINSRKFIHCFHPPNYLVLTFFYLSIYTVQLRQISMSFSEQHQKTTSVFLLCKAQNFCNTKFVRRKIVPYNVLNKHTEKIDVKVDRNYRTGFYKTIFNNSWYTIPVLMLSTSWTHTHKLTKLLILNTEKRLKRTETYPTKKSYKIKISDKSFIQFYLNCIFHVWLLTI